MADVALPNGTTWAEVGEKFIVEAGRVMRIVATAAAAPEAPIVALGAAAVMIAAEPTVPVTREYAESVLAREHAATANAAAYPGVPQAYPLTPSPFSRPGVLESLPTEKMLQAGITAVGPATAAIDLTTAPPPESNDNPNNEPGTCTPARAGHSAATRWR